MDLWKRGLDDGDNGDGEDEMDEQRLDWLEWEMVEVVGEEEKNVMVELEQKMEDVKREMVVVDVLDEIRSWNVRLEKVKSEGVDLLEGLVSKEIEEEKERRRQEEEDVEVVRRVFQFVRRQEMLEEIVEELEGEEKGVDGSNGGLSLLLSEGVKFVIMVVVMVVVMIVGIDMMDMLLLSFKRVVKRKKDYVVLLGIKKKKVV